jgi:uncharacterized protein YcbK (DUF882 family)
VSRYALSRRRVLVAGLQLVPLALLARSVPARAAAPDRALTFVNTHTQEELTGTFYSGGEYDASTLARFNTLLRDHRSGKVGVIDRTLFDHLYEVAERAGAAPIFEVISGFRSQSSNDLLRSRSSGVAKGSLHLQGKAIDVRLHGVSCAALCEVALGMACGGVGYYPKSDFVHLDTGRVRHWAG